MRSRFLPGLLACALTLVSASATPTAAQDEPQVEPVELERRLFGADRKQRREAAWEAMKRRCFDEDTWIRLLQHRLPTRGEEEEARYLAAYALARSGTERALPHLEALLRDPPQVLVEREGPRGGKVRGPAFGYQDEAALGINLITNARVQRRLEAHLAAMSPEDQAEWLITRWAQGDASYADFRRPDDPEEPPALWRGSLAARLRDLGPTGAWAMARALETLESDFVRSELCNELYSRFVSWPLVQARKADPEIERLAKGTPLELAEARRRVLDPRLREPMRAAARALLARPIEDDQHRQGETWVLVQCLSVFDLIDLEPEIVRAIRTTTSQRLRTACYACLRSWAARGHESALDRLIENDWGTAYLPPELVVPKALAELEREQERPWSNHFGWLTRYCGANQAAAQHSDPERLQRVLDRGREILEGLGDGERKETVANHLRTLSEVLANVRRAKGAGGRRD